MVTDVQHTVRFGRHRRRLLPENEIEKNNYKGNRFKLQGV
jgi:hypothetical protein